MEKIEIAQLAEPETTYNFEVADFHTYYVTEKNVLVHNKCRQQALKEAKARAGISEDATPDSVTYEKMISVNGKQYKARTYRYGNKWVRDDFGGHRFIDKMTGRVSTVPRHFNAGYSYFDQGLNAMRDVQFPEHFFYS